MSLQPLCDMYRDLELSDGMDTFVDLGALDSQSVASSRDDVFTSSSLKPTSSLTSVSENGMKLQFLDPDLDDNVESTAASPETEEFVSAAEAHQIELPPGHKQTTEMHKKKLAPDRPRVLRRKKKGKFYRMALRLAELEQENRQLKRVLSSLSLQ